MPENYTGIPANINPALAMNVTGATGNGVSPIELTLSGSIPATFVSGVDISVTQVAGNTAANGIWEANVTGSNTVQLIGSTGNGTYTSGGQVQPLYLAGFQQPTDGDKRTSASVTTPIDSLADQVSYLVVSTGDAKLKYIKNYSADGFLMWASQSHSAANKNSWQPFSLPGSMPFIFSDVNANVNQHDMVEVQLNTSYVCDINGNGSAIAVASLAIFYSIVTPGLSATYTKCPGSAVTLTLNNGTGPNDEAVAQGLVLSSFFMASGSGTLNFQVESWVGSAGFPTNPTFFGLVNDYNLTVKVWRFTGVPQ